MDTRPPLHGLNDESAALRSIVEGTATHTGARFFETLVESLAFVLNTHGAWVTEYLPERRRLRALAFWLGGEHIADFEHGIDEERDLIDAHPDYAEYRRRVPMLVPRPRSSVVDTVTEMA